MKKIILTVLGRMTQWWGEQARRNVGKSGLCCVALDTSLNFSEP